VEERKNRFDGFDVRANYNGGRISSIPQITCTNCGSQVRKNAPELRVECPIQCAGSLKTFTSSDDMDDWLSRAENSLG
jgi:hypothetical protein